MDTLVVVCGIIPVALLGKTVIQNWKVVRWIHFPRWDEKIMAAKKKALETWKMKDGSVVELTSMSDIHLANAIRMVARNCNKPSYLGDMSKDKSFIKLVNEAKKRDFTITILNTPTNIAGRKEYVDVFAPKFFPELKIAAHILLSDWDSRSSEE